MKLLMTKKWFCKVPHHRKTCLWGLWWEAGGRGLALPVCAVPLPGVCRTPNTSCVSDSTSGVFFWSSRRMKINKTCGQLLSTIFWDHVIKLTRQFSCPLQSICVICCRYVHMPSCQKMCICCLYCLSLGKCKNKAMHLL